MPYDPASDIVVVANGNVLAPDRLGRRDVAIVGSRIAKIGPIDQRALAATGLPIDIIDASGCWVVPGLVDPHQHLDGGSGEQGFASRTPPIGVAELIEAGITTVVGCLGTDTTTKTMPSLLAQARALSEDGVSAFVYSGGYTVPPATLTGSIHTDILYVPEVIGAGEIAIADARGSQADARTLARLVCQARVAGSLAGKAGITHFHVGDGRERLAMLRALLDEYPISPEALYPTHVERDEALMSEAIGLTRRGVTVDIDVVERDLSQWLRMYVESGADLGRLTVSSDAAISSPSTLLSEVRRAVCDGVLSLAAALPLISTNAARALGLASKGRLFPGADADLVVLTEDLHVVHVLARGRRMVVDGRVTAAPRSMDGSSRVIALVGTQSLSRNLTHPGGTEVPG